MISLNSSIHDLLLSQYGPGSKSVSYLLRLQVMNPEATGKDYLGVKLCSSKNYHRWCYELEDHIFEISPEWDEYFTSGEVTSVNGITDIDADELAKIKRTLEKATRLLINNSIEDDAADEVEKLIMNSDGRVSSRDIRLMLEDNFGTVSVSDDLNLFPKNRTFKSTTPIIEKKEWSRTMANTVMEYANNIEVLLPDLTIQQRELLAVEKKKVTDYCSTLFYTSCSPELEGEFKGELWGRTPVTTKEVDDFMRVYSASAVSSEPNSNVNPTELKGDHLSSECQESKKYVSNAVIPQEDVKEASAAWIALLMNMGKRITSQFCTDEWILNTGCTKHMTGNINLFDTIAFCDDGYVSGIGGNLPIKGIGSVSVGGITLNTVAYVPGLSVNMMSVHSASRNAGLKITFTSKGVRIVPKSGKPVINGFIKNGLYLLNTNSRKEKS